ncbi:hypothetical protein ABBQ38_001224 [Trebouxia sp. C0009 RCD-2024]
MFSRIGGSNQTEKASQKQVSDKAAAGVTAVTRLVQAVRKDSGTKVLAQSAKVFNTTSERILHTQQTLQRYPAALNGLAASCAAALGVLQHSLPLQHAAAEVCEDLTKQLADQPADSH